MSTTHPYPPQPGFSQHYSPPAYPPPAYGFQGAHPAVHGPPPGPPVNYPQHDYRQIPIPPPPIHSGYIPTSTHNYQDPHRPPQHLSRRDERRNRCDDRRPRDRWGDRRGDKRRNEARENSDHRNHSRDETWRDRGRKGNYGSFESFEGRKHRETPEDQLSYDRDDVRSLSLTRSERSNRGHSQKPPHLRHTSSHNTPTPNVAVPLSIEPALVADKGTEFSEAEGSVTSQKHDHSGEDHASRLVKGDKEESVAQTGASERTGRNEDDGQQAEDDLLEELSIAFVDFVPEHKGDPIAEPLPHEYTEDIMLPPAFDAKGVKSKHITPSNLDDFALSIRDTNQWNQYRNHPAFLSPEEVNLKALESYVRFTQKGQGHRNEKRGRTHGHLGKDQSRNQRSTNRDRGEIDRPKPDMAQRKRKRNEIHPDQEAAWYGRGHFGDFDRSLEDRPARALRPTSPEPGEISDTPVSLSVLHHAQRPAHLPPKPDMPRWVENNHTRYQGHQRSELAKHFAYGPTEHHRSFAAQNTVEHYEGRPNSPESTGYSPRPLSPYFSGRQSPSPIPRHQSEEIGSRESREPSQKPLLDALQSHIDMLCASATSSKTDPSASRPLDRGIDEPLPPPRLMEITSRHNSVDSAPGSHPASPAGIASRRSSIDNLSQSSDIGSPLTRIEAELLGLIGANDGDDESKSPKRPQEDRKGSFKRKQRKIHSAFE